MMEGFVDATTKLLLQCRLQDLMLLLCMRVIPLSVAGWFHLSPVQEMPSAHPLPCELALLDPHSGANRAVPL